jgi:hypothetical protein
MKDVFEILDQGQPGIDDSTSAKAIYEGRIHRFAQTVVFESYSSLNVSQILAGQVSNGGTDTVLRQISDLIF